MESPNIENLMQQACEVRDEQTPEANTAHRVGQLLTGIVSGLSASYPYTSAEVATEAQTVSINYTVARPDGTPAETESLQLPAATTEAAGVMTAADKAALDATGRTVDVRQLDAMLQGKTLMEVLPLLGEWTVTDTFAGRPVPTGRLTMYLDNMAHQVTQELHANYLPSMEGHQDLRVNVLRRSYGLRNGDGGLTPGEFSPWTYVGPPPATAAADGTMTAAHVQALEYLEGHSEFIRDIGTFDSKDAACTYAARSEIAGDKKAALLIFHATGATGERLDGRILQMVSGNQISMQILMWDKRLMRRNVTGATGRPGDGTNAFAWEEMAPQKLAYNAAARILTMSSYENGVVASVTLPEATKSAPGLMGKADKEYLLSIPNAVIAPLQSRITNLETRVTALEQLIANT